VLEVVSGSRRVGRLRARNKVQTDARAAIATKAVAYVRVSTEEQAATGHGLETQDKAVRAFAESQGYELVEVASDPGVSGATRPADRPGFGRVLELAAAGAFTVLLVYKFDRLAREIRYAVTTVSDLAESHDVVIRSVTEPIDTATPMGRTLGGMTDTDASDEGALSPDEQAHLDREALLRKLKTWFRADRDDARTGVLVGPAGIHPDPMNPGAFLEPAFTTAIAPPTEIPAGEAAVFADDAWALVPDHRGETWFQGAEPISIERLGDPTTQGLTKDPVLPPPPPPSSCSKLGLKRAFTEKGLWPTVRAMIASDADMQEDWDLATELRITDPIVRKAAGGLTLAGIPLSDADVQALVTRANKLVA
jgi:predicted site-specific integrase-resolvase